MTCTQYTEHYVFARNNFLLHLCHKELCMYKNYIEGRRKDGKSETKRRQKIETRTKEYKSFSITTSFKKYKIHGQLLIYFIKFTFSLL